MLVKHLHKRYISHNQTLFSFDASISTRDLRQKELFNSPSSSCHSNDVTWQEIGRTSTMIFAKYQLRLFR